MELVQHLMEKVGLSEQQAKGGAGLLLQQAKEKLSGDQFDKVKEAIPNADELADEAPAAEEESVGLGGMLGGLTSKIGGLGSLAGLAVCPTWDSMRLKSHSSRPRRCRG